MRTSPKVVVASPNSRPKRRRAQKSWVCCGSSKIHGAVQRFDGQASVFWADYGPCYRCLYPEPPPPGLVPSCAEGGVLGVLPGGGPTLGAFSAYTLEKKISRNPGEFGKGAVEGHVGDAQEQANYRG